MEPLSIAIIEDEEAHFNLMKRAIGKNLENVVVCHFSEPQSCFESLSETIPALIITDYLMPGMNGIEFITLLNQKKIDVPVVMITGQGDEIVAAHAMKLGAKDYLVKSGHFFDLLPQVIEKVIDEKKTSDALKKADARIRNLSQMLLQAQERERQIISYELHDHILQKLSSLKIDCDMLFDGETSVSPALRAKSKKISNLSQQIIADIRNLAYGLRPPFLEELGLEKAIEKYCKDIAENNHMTVECQSAGMPALRLDLDTQIHIYRLVQEGLNNIRKHASADQATIKLLGAYPNILLRIEDNGKGFDVEEQKSTQDDEKRMGLRSMQERVNLHQGEMTIQSRPGQGTKIFIKIPIRTDSGDEKETNPHH